MHLQGTVLSVDGETVTVIPKHEDLHVNNNLIIENFISYTFSLSLSLSLQDPLEFQTRELRKFFQVGDHVKVIAGRHEGETGLIVRIENNLAILFADLTMHEVKHKIMLMCSNLLCTIVH